MALLLISLHALKTYYKSRMRSICNLMQGFYFRNNFTIFYFTNIRLRHIGNTTICLLVKQALCQNS